jgi:hypothetical protein
MTIAFLKPLHQKFKVPIEDGRFPRNVYVYVNNKEDYVIKYFSPHCSPNNRFKEWGGAYNNELLMYKIFEKNNCKQVPKLLDYSDTDLFIKMEKCNSIGKHNFPTNWKSDALNFFEICDKEQIFPFDLSNFMHILTKNNTVKFIDFTLYQKYKMSKEQWLNSTGKWEREGLLNTREKILKILDSFYKKNFK